MLALIAAHSEAQSIQPLSDRIDAIVAHPLVLPIKVPDPQDLKSGLRVQIDDGRTVDASAHFVWATTTKQTIGWTSDTPLWNILDTSGYLKNPPNSPGTWIAVVDLPIDAVGQGIWIQNTRYEANWLPSPHRVILETSNRSNDGFWDPALTPTQQSSPLVEHAITTLRADPFNRWRARLMTQGFSPSTNEQSGPTTTDRDLTAIHTELLQTDAVSVLDQIADHFEARWQIILGRIWLIDPQAAHRLKHQLTQTAKAQDHQIPMWTDDTNELAALAHDLLSPYVNDALRAERVTGWLDTQTSAANWIIDDAGHPSRHPMMSSLTIGMLKLGQNNQPALVRIQSRGINPVVEQLRPGSFNSRSIDLPTLDSNPQFPQPRQIRVQIGKQHSTLNASSSIPICTPPGLVIGPMLNDWTLSALTKHDSSISLLPSTDKQVAGLLSRTAQINTSNPATGWRLYLECAGADQSTQLRIWAGPMNHSRASWTITKELGLIETRTDPDIPSHTDLITVTEGGRWIIQLDLPPEVISTDGFLLLGLERTDENSHTAWPRRMMPWQSEPGRFAVDINGWAGIP